MIGDDDDDDDVDAARSGKRMSFFAAMAWTLGLGLLTVSVAELTEGARPGAALDLINLAACEVMGVSVAIFALLRIYAPHASIRDVLGVRSVSALVVVLAVVVGVLLIPGTTLISEVLAKRFPSSPEEVERMQRIDEMVSLASRGRRAFTFVAYGAVLPVFQELFFRGMLFRGLRRGRPEGSAILAVTLLSGMSYLADPRAMPAAMVLALLTSWLRGRSGSIVPAVVASVAATAVPLVPMLIGRGDFEFGGRLTVGATIGAGGCAWALAMVLARDGTAEEGRIEDV